MVWEDTISTRRRRKDEASKLSGAFRRASACAVVSAARASAVARVWVQGRGPEPYNPSVLIRSTEFEQQWHECVLFRHVLRIDPGPVPTSRRTRESRAEEPGWEIRFTPEAERWYLGLDDRAAESIAAAFDELARLGPAARRPSVGTIHGSRNHNMKEARSFGGNLRALLARVPQLGIGFRPESPRDRPHGR